MKWCIFILFLEPKCLIRYDKWCIKSIALDLEKDEVKYYIMTVKLVSITHVLLQMLQRYKNIQDQGIKTTKIIIYFKGYD